MVAGIKKPTLSRLKGNLKLDPVKRVKYNVDNDILLGEFRDWSDYKKLIDSYFENACNNWEESAEAFITNIINTFERLRDRRGAHAGSDKLFSEYCRRLHEYYNSQVIKKNMTRYYESQELNTRIRWREQQAIAQARSTSLTFVQEQGMILETESSSRMNLKRKGYDDLNDSRSQKAKENERRAPSQELPEFDSFITDESDETYETEKESIHYGDKLKVRTFMLTMSEMNRNEKGSQEVYVYDESSSLDERLLLSNIILNNEYDSEPIILEDEEYSQIREWRLCVKKKNHYFPPQPTTVNQLNLNQFLYYANETILSDDDYVTTEDKKSGMVSIVDNVSPIFRYIFPSKDQIKCKWDKSSFLPKSKSTKTLRHDFILRIKDLEIGCGEVKKDGTADDLLNNDRGRIAETMKRQLHYRILKSKDPKEHVTFGIFFHGCDIELYLMRFDEGAEYSYQLHELTKLKSPTSISTYASMEETLEYLNGFKTTINSTLPTDNDTENPCMHFNYSLFKPTLSFKNDE